MEIAAYGTEADQRSEEEAEQIDDEMRFPDTALDKIFSCLDFSDIKSCRLVSKQWHRYALDNFSFILFLKFSPAEKPTNQNGHRFQMALVPYSSTLSEKAVQKIIEQTAEGAKRTNKEIDFNAIDAAIDDSFKQKIKHVIVKNARQVILEIIEAFVQMTPAASSVYAVYQRDSQTSVIWAAELGREEQTGNFKFRQLDLGCFKDRGLELLANDANFIVNLVDDDFVLLQDMLSDNETLVFEKCLQLEVSELCNAPFRSIAVHFPNLQKLACAIGTRGQPYDFEHLEQLASLKSLAIADDWGINTEPVVEKLCLPNLDELCLCRNIRLPEDPRHFISSGLKQLTLDAHLTNMLRLEDCIRHHGRGCYSNLTTLTAKGAKLELIERFLRIMLTAANNLQRLELLQDIKHDQVAIIPTIYDIVAELAPGLASLTIGFIHARLKRKLASRKRVLQLIDDIKQRRLKAAITIGFYHYIDCGHEFFSIRRRENGRTMEALQNAVDGEHVAISALIDDAEFGGGKSCELTWHNDVAGIQQKLKIIMPYDCKAILML